jgi:hypothetical protein
MEVAIYTGAMGRASVLVALLASQDCLTVNVYPAPVASSPPAPPSRSVLYVSDATYGGNCGAVWGNATEALAKACNGLASCDYRVDYRVIGDPAIGCGKNYVAHWRCGYGVALYRTVAQPEAGFGSVIHMTCDGTEAPVAAAPLRGNIEVASATYGGNCGAPGGNDTTNVAAACEGKRDCVYRVDYHVIGDPTFGCAKDYVVQWRCHGSPDAHEARAAPEAGYGALVALDCRGD